MAQPADKMRASGRSLRAPFIFRSRSAGTTRCSPAISTGRSSCVIGSPLRRNYRSERSRQVKVLGGEAWILGAATAAIPVVLSPPEETPGGRHVDHPPHSYQDRSVADRDCRAYLENGMRDIDDLAEGVHFREAVASAGARRVHLLFRMGDRGGHRTLHEQSGA